MKSFYFVFYFYLSRWKGDFDRQHNNCDTQDTPVSVYSNHK